MGSQTSSKVHALFDLRRSETGHPRGSSGIGDRFMRLHQRRVSRRETESYLLLFEMHTVVSQ